MANSITQLLDRIRAGDGSARDALLVTIYDDIRRLAASQLRRGNDLVLQTTALANETCKKLITRYDWSAADRAEFLKIVSRAMRDVLVDHIRFEKAEKRGGACSRVKLADRADAESITVDVLDLDTALSELEIHDPVSAQAVTLRFFMGQTLEEAADTMGCTFGEFRRHWDYARAWLYQRLQDGYGPD